MLYNSNPRKPPDDKFMVRSMSGVANILKNKLVLLDGRKEKVFLLGFHDPSRRDRWIVPRRP